MKLFANPEAEKWKEEAYRWKESSDELYRQLTNAGGEIRQLKQQLFELQKQNVQLAQQIKQENPFDRSQLRLILEILQRIPKAIKPLRKMTSKSGLNLILLDKEEVETLIREYVQDPKVIIQRWSELGIIKKKEGYQYPCRVDGDIVRGYALVSDRARWYVYDAMKPLVTEER